MDAPRTDPLSDKEIAQFYEDGCLSPIRVFSLAEVAEIRAALKDHLAGRISTPTYELTDPTRVRRVQSPTGRIAYEYEEGELSKPNTFPFLFNLWRRDERFRKVVHNPILAGMARQLLGADAVVLMEDNVVIKMPQSKTLPWHQDFSYWPLATPDAVTLFIALDDITAENGAMQVVHGSHRLGERLPVSFGDARSFMAEERPDVGAITQDPAADGHDVVTVELRSGEGGFHDALLWHASGPNLTQCGRHAFIVRYVKSGTIWLGNERFPYDAVDCEVGDPIGGATFPQIATAF